MDNLKCWHFRSSHATLASPLIILLALQIFISELHWNFSNLIYFQVVDSPPLLPYVEVQHHSSKCAVLSFCFVTSRYIYPIWRTFQSSLNYLKNLVCLLAEVLNMKRLSTIFFSAYSGFGSEAKESKIWISSKIAAIPDKPGALEAPWYW
jgi:hypothetical protein